MKEKLQLLRQLEYELHEEEALLDCYTKNVPPDQITFAMELADRANRKAYEYKKEVIENLKKELAQEAEIITLHIVTPGEKPGVIPLPTFLALTGKYQESLYHLAEDVKKYWKQKHISLRRFSIDLDLFALTPGSFQVHLGNQRDPEDLFKDDEAARAADLHYQLHTLLLEILENADDPYKMQEKLDPLGDTTLCTIRDLYKEIDKDHITLDISWNYHPTIVPFTLSYKKAASYAALLETYLKNRQKNQKEQILTGRFTAINAESHYFRFRETSSAKAWTIHFSAEAKDTLRDYGVNPLDAQEYTIRITEEKSEKYAKTIWYFQEFLEKKLQRKRPGRKEMGR